MYIVYTKSPGWSCACGSGDWDKTRTPYNRYPRMRTEICFLSTAKPDQGRKSDVVDGMGPASIDRRTNSSKWTELDFDFEKVGSASVSQSASETIVGLRHDTP